MTPVRAATALFAIGLGGGVVVTRNAHRHPSSPWWEERVGRTRLRRADLPLVGTIAFALVPALRASGHRSAGVALAGLGAGAALGAVGTGLAEPLPPLR